MAVSPPTSIYQWIVFGIALVIFKFIMDKVLLLRIAFSKIKDYPGCVPLWLEPFMPMAFMLGTTFPRPGMAGYYAGKFSLYEKFGATSFASIKISSAQPFFWLADPEAIKLVISDRHTFQKDIAHYGTINVYGESIISTEGSDWKRHRSVAMSAFSKENIALVWSESLRVINEWFELLDDAGPDIAVDMKPHILEATLLVIATASLGRWMSWTTESTTEPPPGCKLTLRSAVMNSSKNLFFKALTPGWFYRLSSLIEVPYFSSRALLTQLAFDDLRIHMLDLVASARAEIMSGEHSRASGAALLRNLIEANVNQDRESKKLTEGEVLSDIFSFLIAGHETSAHTLCFVFVLLALYPDCQQKLYEEVTHVWLADTLTTDYKECMDKLEYTAACIHETLRMFPPEPGLPRDVHKDTILPCAYFTSESKECPIETRKFSMAVPAGSIVIVDIWALHMNPLYWGKDTEEFKPERFIDTGSYQWPRKAFLAFSGGARSCIGQQFALAQMISILASIVRRYWIRVPNDLAGKPFEEQKEELLKWTTGVTLTPLNARVKLCRRV